MIKTVMIVCLGLLIIQMSYGEQLPKPPFTFLKHPVTIQIDHANSSKIVKVKEKIEAELSRIEKQFASYVQGSVVNKINQYAGSRPVAINQEMMILLDWSKVLAQRSEGSFDLTCAVYLWHYGFGQQDFRVPNFLQLDGVKPLVDYQLIIQDQDEQAVLFKRDGVQININTILVSYAYEKLNALLDKHKIKHASILIGQNFLARGTMTADKKWTHQVMSTWQPIQPIKQLVITEGQILVHEIFTNSFVKKEKHYHPLMDPKTGLPYQFSKMAIVYNRQLGSKTIPPALLLTVKPKQAISLIDEEQDSACLIIDQHNRYHYSKQWSRWFAK